MSARSLGRAEAEAAADHLKIYAQPQRLMILSLLLAGERTVGDIDSETSIGQPALSQQLAVLRGKGIVRARRQGTLVFYALADDRVAHCVRCIGIMVEGGEPAGVAAYRHPSDVASGQDEPAGPVGAQRMGVAHFARMMPKESV